MILFIRICGIVFSTLLLVGTTGSDLVAVEVDQQALYQYAHSFAERGDFKSASEEYLRMATYIPNLMKDAAHVLAMFRYAEKSENSDYLLSLSKYMSSKSQENNIRCLAEYYSGRAYYQMRSYESALRNFESITACANGLDMEASYYKALAKMRLHQWDAAVANLQSIDANVVNTKAALEVARKGNDLDFKSPRTAAALSGVIPGAGYAYARAPMTALAAVLTTGLLAWGSYALFDNDHPAAGAILGAFGLSWHFGGVVGSYKMAARYNNYLGDRLIGPNELP